MNDLKPPRVIKFRAWDKRTKRFVQSGIQFNNSLMQLDYIPDLEIMQFTGLLDKNGKEIYEGDVCKNEYGWIGSIIYDSDVPYGESVSFTGWWWKSKERKDGKWPFHLDKKTEIIGNIYENPDLLKTGSHAQGS